MSPLPDSDFLNPTHAVESPGLEVGRHGFFDPTHRAPAILVAPDMDVLWITQRGGVDVIETHREERLAIRRSNRASTCAT